MRITEQIDALEIMGVNSASYLILPKIVAAVVFFPFLTILSIAIGIIGGWAIAYLTGIMIPADYVDGLLMDFKPYSIVYSLIKTAVFAYIITSISAFYGYYAKGNSLEVGAASTRAVVASSVVIMIFNLITDASPADMIRAEHITKSFDGRVVLDDISIEFLTGKTNLIIGRSGSGKTVLLKTLVGLHEPDSGDVWYDDTNFTRLDFRERRAIRKDIGMIFQGGALLDSSTVEENVKLPLDLFTSQSEKEKMERVDFCLQRVRLEDANHLYPAELSGGHDQATWPSPAPSCSIRATSSATNPIPDSTRRHRSSSTT